MNDSYYDNLTEEEWEQKRKESWKKIEAEIKKREEAEAKKPAILRWIRKVYLWIETKIEFLQVEYKMRTDKEKMMEAEMKAAEIIKETVELKQEATEKLEKIISLESEMKELEEIQERTPIFDKSNVVVKDVKVGGMFSKETTKIVELDYDDYKTFSISIDSKNLNKKTHEKIEKGEKIMKKYADMMMSDKEKELLLKVDELENKLFAAEKTIKERDREIINQNRLIQKLNDFIDRTRELLHKYAPRLEQILWPNGDEDQKRNEHENNYDEFEFER